MAKDEFKRTDIHSNNIGVMGDHAHIEGGIHFYPTSPPDNPEHRNRAAMLQLVYNTWIVGVLEQSLHSAVVLELSKDYAPQAVERPWDLELHLPGQERRPVPHGTPILELLHQCSEAFLILGDPGSGKTTTLLQLARDAIMCAQADSVQPIPVVFNLSSWTGKRRGKRGREVEQTFVEWLIDELNNKYHVPRKLARYWVENDRLFLLLDGLDEVRTDARNACVRAINGFRHDHGFVPLAVCSRVADYETLTTRLELHGAILLQPLTPTQIDEYLTGAGIELKAVRATLKNDPVLQEMAQSPLFLNIMTLAYRGKTIDDLQTLSTPEARRQHLFNTYIQQMFQRRTKVHPYSQESILHWLSYLAQQMTSHGHSIFLVENLQPDWLTSYKTKFFFLLVLSGVAIFNGIIVGLISGLFGLLLLGPSFGIYFGFFYRT